ncbi:MAG: 6,7-dimethyl-8-ribityllumazine synthase [Legionella sp.]
MQQLNPAINQQPVASFAIAIISSTFNSDITSELEKGTLEQLTRRGVSRKDISIYQVPGAIEIPLLAKRLALQNKFKSIIALGSVIRGDTSHYDVVCDLVSQGCMRVSLDHNIPVILGVLTTENEQQAWDRLGGVHGHKGVQMADCAITMHELYSTLG